MMKTLSLKLPEGLFQQITAIARARGESRSALVREAIESLIKGDHRPQGGSCLDRAGDLAGVVQNGATDLSFDKTHLRGYGQ